MMDDLISRQAAIEAMDECYWSIIGDEPPKLDEKTALYVDLKQAVKRLPTAEPRPGKWIEKGDDWEGVYYECSCCKEAFTLIDGTPTDNLYNYCPNCGTKMEESE